MDEDKDMIETFKRLSAEAKHMLLLQANSALRIEETARRLYGLLPGSSPARGDPVVGRGKLA
jgi:hypothetical protein